MKKDLTNRELAVAGALGASPTSDTTVADTLGEAW